MSGRQPEPQNEIAAWYNDIPICTKFLFTSFILVTLLGRFIIDPFKLVYIPQYTFFHFQIWRLYTSFFYYSFNLSGAFQLYFLYRYSNEIETSKFAGKTADYVFFLLFESLTILILGWFFGLLILNQSLVMAIIYIWSQYNREVIVTFIFGIRFRGVYLPYVLLIFELLQVGIPWASIVGMLTGHLYYYLQDLYPETGGARLLNTPQWLYNYFPVQVDGSGGIQTSFGRIYNPPQQSENTGRHWGRGRRLDS